MAKKRIVKCAACGEEELPQSTCPYCKSGKTYCLSTVRRCYTKHVASHNGQVPKRRLPLGEGAFRGVFEPQGTCVAGVPAPRLFRMFR